MARNQKPYPEDDESSPARANDPGEEEVVVDPADIEEALDDLDDIRERLEDMLGEEPSEE